MSGQFSQPHFLHIRSGLRFLASMILNIVMHLCWFCACWCVIQEFVFDFVKILTEVGKFEEIQLEIHGVLSDAGMLVTCCVTHEQWKVTCFVTRADNSTLLCREGDVEANVSLHLHATFRSCLLLFDAVCTVSTFSLVKGCNTFSPVLRTIVVYSCLERCPYLERCACLKRAPVGGSRFRPRVAVFGGCRFRHKFLTYEMLGNFQFCSFLLFDCRVESHLETVAHLLTHPVPLPLRVLLTVALQVSRKNSTAWNGRLDAAFSVDEASVKEAAVACCVPFLLVSSVFVRGSGMDVFTCVHCVLCETPSWHGQCLCCMVIASIAILLLC